MTSRGQYPLDDNKAWFVDDTFLKRLTVSMSFFGNILFLRAHDAEHEHG